MQDFLSENIMHEGENLKHSSPSTTSFIYLKNSSIVIANYTLFQCIKRFFDILISCIAIIFFFLVLPPLAFAIKLDSTGPIFYSQKRIGQYGKIFRIWKLRTMYKDAEKNTGAVWSCKNDPRITPIGKILRKLHIDEIPQFFNILKGDMSCIGPRPERPEFLEQINKVMPYYNLRHCIKPGITGLAQIKLPYAASLKETAAKLEYDLFYVENISMYLDCKIALSTFIFFIKQSTYKV